MKKNIRSIEAFQEAKEYIPGGVNSPARAFTAVGCEPRFIARGEGSHVWDIDGNEFIDYVCSWGPLAIGHSNPMIIDAIKEVAALGTTFGAPTLLETKLAKKVIELVPSVEKVRMVSSGTEATMSAIRLARGHTNREKILKFEGCWHGHGDSFLIKAGSSSLTLGVPDSLGIPQGIADNTITVPYNDTEAVRKAIEQNSGNVAAIIVEPVAGNMGTVPPQDDFLPDLRKISSNEGCILIFDEVITGFRVAQGGAQEYYGVDPDLTCLGKILGGGLPAAAYGGRREIMDNVSPSGKKIAQAGTLSGNPLAMAAGLAQLDLLSDSIVFQKLITASEHLEIGMNDNIKRLGLDYSVNRVGGMLTMFFKGGKISCFGDLADVDLSMFSKYFRSCLERGIYIPPSQYECMFPSVAHTEQDIEKTISIHYDVLKNIHQ
ncbi:MAG: glutamate-1-semialdehyde 2,1-aminomutase [Candidatus Latescibacterota bacterium]|nr:glutamate-1-semialdehyde 2,1-aminomutase [Candidatus Latescibacterota bacterium]